MAVAQVGPPAGADVSGLTRDPVASPSRASTAAWLEAFAGLCLVAVLLWLAGGVWQVYDTAMRPHARTAGELPPRDPPHVRADDPAAVRRLQQVTNLLGEAGAYREAGEDAWAEATLRRALEADPANREALEMRARWAPAPAPTPGPIAAEPGPTGPPEHAPESDIER
jgi:hypothetical protein